MSAADAREELEAAVGDFQVQAATCRHTAECRFCAANAAALLAAADAYANAVADERVNRMTPEQWRARLRLAEVTAEADGRAS